jgi:hypothetical protein
VEYPFNKEVAKMDPEEFVSHVLVEQMHARAVVVGTDCRFGHKAAGDAKLLKELSRKYGFEAVIVEKLLDGNREISSTYVREELAAGHIRKAGLGHLGCASCAGLGHLGCPGCASCAGFRRTLRVSSGHIRQAGHGPALSVRPLPQKILLHIAFEHSEAAVPDLAIAGDHDHGQSNGEQQDERPHY